MNPVLLKARVGSSLEKKRLRDRQRATLARLGPGLLDAPAAAPDARCGEATVLAACVCGYVRRPGRGAAPETIELLSNWNTLMIDAIEGHGGRIQQMIGDGLSAVFGPLRRRGRPRRPGPGRGPRMR